VTVSAVVAALDRRYDPATAAAWDAVGLVCGDPDAPVARVHFAVDPVEAAAHEAIDSGAEVLVTHHPLYLRGTSTVAATSGKGRLVHRMIRAGVALYTAHTNADVAMPGVSDALANAVGVDEVEPLQVAEPETWDKLTVYVPQAHAQRLVDALSAAGAGRLGDYDRCAYLVDGTGTFRPGPGATPAIGRVGQVVTVTETRIEMVAPRRLRPAVTSALLAQHPYEEPAWDVVELAPRSGRTGLGRVGRLRQPCRLAELVRRVAGP
jgi:putative NIF3 family GTP cyclohydrolase 1 type 2